jgi:hypothetical protein
MRTAVTFVVSCCVVYEWTAVTFVVLCRVVYEDCCPICCIAKLVLALIFLFAIINPVVNISLTECNSGISQQRV